jgi:hypothetical protein
VPFTSEKQRRFLHANHPEIAQRWEKEYGPPRKKKKKRKTDWVAEEKKRG